jgi:hypothetical protein
MIGASNAGAVQVLYGDASGQYGFSSTLWSQDSPGIPGTAESGDEFGFSLATGDFDHDGYNDLAIGIPAEPLITPGAAAEMPEAIFVGAVQVLYGSASGLTSAGNQYWQQGAGGLPGSLKTGDQFGTALAAGDFDGDGYTDLAAGNPYDDIDSPAVVDAGTVQVIYGSATGLTAAGSLLLSQALAGVEDSPEANDHFGTALATGHFNNDPYADLAVGVAGEGVGSPAVSGAGAVQIFYGLATGLDTVADLFLYQGRSGIAGPPTAAGGFGSALAAGDFDADGLSDLAVGVPKADVSSITAAGEVIALYGPGPDSATVRNQVWSQGSAGVQGAVEQDDNFGSALAAGDFDGDGFADLGIGTPHEDVNAVSSAGAAQVIYGAGSGLTAAGNQMLYEGYNGIAGTPLSGEQFGFSLAAINRTFKNELPLVIKK